MLRARFVVSASLVFASCAAAASAATTVPGHSNPNLAGRAGGYLCCGGDGSPPQDPALVDEVEIGGCDTLQFSATGRVSFTSSVDPGNNPDGDATFSMTNYGDGLSAPTNVRANALLGVFLTDDSPTGKPTPEQLNFSGNGLEFGYLYPDIGQIFFIGDGLTSDSALGETDGFLQHIIAPAGTTRLFLGTADGSGWHNNAGSFSVDIDVEEYDPGRECGDSVDPLGITTSDALRILRYAVGTALCSFCICDTDNSGSVAASDALAVLRVAVGQNIDLVCGCCFLE